MKCDIQSVVKNPRYRILAINGEHYLLDMWRSFWKIIFPFLFWLLPNTVFKVEDPELVKKLREREVKQQTKLGTAGTLLGGGIAVFLGNLLTPLIERFGVESTIGINISIVAITIILMSFLFFYMTRLSKNRLYKMINMEQLSTSRLWIRPGSIKRFLQVLFQYFFLLSLTVLFFGGFFEMQNIIMLLLAAVCFLLVLISSLLAVTGDQIVVKFKRSKKQLSNAKQYKK